jgi:DNA-binding NarL/FixJ family response regulator
MALKMYEEAMSMSRAYDLVIMDLTVPGGMGGKDAVIKLREIDPAARVIVSSGYYTDPIMANYKDYGFDGVVPKPYQIDELGRAVKQILADK